MKIFESNLCHVTSPFDGWEICLPSWPHGFESTIPGGHLELFDRLDDADKWPGSIGRHSDFYSAQPGP